MRSIGEFFSKIQNNQAQKLVVLKIVQEAVKKHAKIEVTLGSISFKGRNLSIRGLGQAEKSDIFIKKSRILEEINAKTSPRIVGNILFGG